MRITKIYQLCINISTLVLVFAIDRLTKSWAIATLATPQVIVPNVLELSYVRNTRIAFFIALPQWVIVSIVMLILFVMIVAVVRAIERNATALVFGLGCIIIGAVSNALDRIRFGAVIDFINVPFWSVFNVADISIVVGVLVVALAIHFDKRIKTASL